MVGPPLYRPRTSHRRLLADTSWYPGGPGNDPSARTTRQVVVDELAAHRDGLLATLLRESVLASPDVLLEQYASKLDERGSLGIVKCPQDALAVVKSSAPRPSFRSGSAA